MFLDQLFQFIISSLHPWLSGWRQGVARHGYREFMPLGCNPREYLGRLFSGCNYFGLPSMQTILELEFVSTLYQEDSLNLVYLEHEETLSDWVAERDFSVVHQGDVSDPPAQQPSSHTTAKGSGP